MGPLKWGPMCLGVFIYWPTLDGDLIKLAALYPEAFTSKV
jgi:hypothetical protein